MGVGGGGGAAARSACMLAEGDAGVAGVAPGRDRREVRQVQTHDSSTAGERVRKKICCWRHECIVSARNPWAGKHVLACAFVGLCPVSVSHSVTRKPAWQTGAQSTTCRF